MADAELASGGSDTVTLAAGPVAIRVPGIVAPDRAAAARRLAVLSGVAVVADLSAVAAGYLVAGPVAADLLATLALWPPVFVAYGLYDRRRLAAPSEEASRLFHAVTVAAVAVVVVTFLAGQPLERSWVAVVWGTTLPALAAVRLAQRKLVQWLAAAGVLGTRVVVVGTNDEARTIARMLNRQRWLGYVAVGFVAVGPEEGAIDGLPVLGRMDDVAAAVGRADAGAVLVAGTAVRGEVMQELCATLQSLEVEIRISAGLPQVAASRMTLEPLDGLAVLSVRRNQLSRSQAATKRIVDVIGSVTALVVAAPVMVGIAIALRIGSGRPVLFRQLRVGEGGRPFVIYKFRTMVVGAEERVIDLRGQNDADGLLFKVLDDPRVTRVGRFLRRWGLDELPQLVNVLRGEMSLVGPRPPLPGETARYDEWVRGRLRVKPGITGLWQVNGRHELSFADYVRYDLFYVENWSLLLDVYVLARTIPAVIAGRGAA